MTKGAVTAAYVDELKRLHQTEPLAPANTWSLLLRQVYCFSSESVTEVFLYAVTQWSVPKRLPTHGNHCKPATVFQDGTWAKHAISVLLVRTGSPDSNSCCGWATTWHISCGEVCYYCCRRSDLRTIRRVKKIPDLRWRREPSHTVSTEEKIRDWRGDSSQVSK